MKLFSFLLLLLTFACRAECTRVDAFDSVLERDSGGQAVNCDCVDMKAEHAKIAKADECVGRAFAEGKAFRVRYLDQGKQSPFMSAKVRSPGGRVFFYSFDGRIGKVTRFTCTRPELQAHEGHRHLICMACLECTAMPVTK